MGSRASTSWALLALTAGCLAQPSEPNVLPPPPPVIPPVPTELVCEHPEETSTAFTPSRLLTRFEYDNTVRDLLGLPESVVPSEGFPAENRVNGFDNNAIAHVVNPLLVANYIDAAERLAALALRDARAALVPCDPAQIAPLDCGKQLIARLLPRAFRRPPTAEETRLFEGFFEQALADDDFDTAVSLVVQAVLQSPQLLYRLEANESEAAPGALTPLTGYALASRLSYFLWASGPDAALLAAAADGSLDTAAGYQAQVQRMLGDARARRMVRHFHRQWLGTERLPTITKDLRAFPDYVPELRESWLGSIDRFVEDAYFGGGGLRSLFGDPSVWVDETLARSLGLPPPRGGGWEKLERDPALYAGLLTQPAVLAELALPSQGSPIRRGVFVREKLLCQTLPIPPPNVPIMPPDPDPSLTTRERFKVHTKDGYCASCHVRIDPLGFALESFDALGRYRATESGKPIDTTGELTHLRDPAHEGPLTGAVDLAHRLAEMDEVGDCVTKQWFRYAIGREPEAADVCSLVNAEAVFADSDGDLLAMLAAIVETDAFRYRVVGALP